MSGVNEITLRSRMKPNGQVEMCKTNLRCLARRENVEEFFSEPKKNARDTVGDGAS